jgi:hypothetical protein
MMLAQKFIMGKHLEIAYAEGPEGFKLWGRGVA